MRLARLLCTCHVLRVFSSRTCQFFHLVFHHRLRARSNAQYIFFQQKKPIAARPGSRILRVHPTRPAVRIVPINFLVSIDWSMLCLKEHTYFPGFATRTDLFVHETSHSKFACFVCDEKFDTFPLLTKHRNKQCMKTSVLPRLKTLKDVRRWDCCFIRPVYTNDIRQMSDIRLCIDSTWAQH